MAMFSSALIPIIFILTALNNAVQLPTYDLYSEDISDIFESQDEGTHKPFEMGPDGMVLFSELKPHSVPHSEPVSGPSIDPRMFKLGYEDSMKSSKKYLPHDAEDPEEAIHGTDSTNARQESRAGVDLSVMDTFEYNGIIEELGWYAAGEVGKTTVFTFWIENVGVTQANSYDVTFKMFDLYHREAENQTMSLTNLAPSMNASVNFNWIPTYSNYYNISVTVSSIDDVNNSNDHRSWKWIIAVKWSDDFASNGLSSWSGDKASTQWHITNTIEDDPDTEAHSSPEVLYHGEETASDNYGIGEDYYLTLPSFDLRRFETNPGTYLFYQFYGSASPGDELILEVKTNPDQDFEYSDILPKLTGDTKDVSNNWEWQAWRGESANISGIPISIFTGEIVQFRLHWASDNQPEDKIGFYLDDFLLFGLEAPPPDRDAGLDKLEVAHTSNPWDMPVVGDSIDISVNVKNYGRSALNSFEVKLSIHDEQKREVTTLVQPVKTVSSLEQGSDVDLTWEFIPEVGGNFYISVENLLDDDGNEINDIVSNMITVAKHYFNGENSAEGWETEGGFSLVIVPNDPNPSGHSSYNAWYFGGLNYTYDPNMVAVLRSPIIDLQGVNPNNNDIKIFTNFKFYGNTADTDILFFEYALDGSDDWSLVNDGGALGYDYSTTIRGYYGVQWNDLDEIKKVQVGSTDFIGHSVQFRWRFVSDNVDEDLPGFFIDDFVVWSIEEDYNKPTVLSANISKPELENQWGDSAVISAKVLDRNNDIVPGAVTVDLSPLGGDPRLVMLDDGTGIDELPDDGIYTMNISAGPAVDPGNKILVVKVVDSEANIGLGYIKLTIIENEAPILTVTPKEQVIKVNENSSISFQSSVKNDGEIITYRWLINDNLIQEGTDKTSYDFQTSYDGNYSAGTYHLNVTVLDDALPPKNSSFEWTISVVDILPDLVLNSTQIQVSDKEPTFGDVVYFNLSVTNLGIKDEEMVNVAMYENKSGPGSKLRFIDSIIIPRAHSAISSQLSFKWNAVDRIGEYEFIFIVDPDDNIPELREDNNRATAAIIVKSPPVLIPEPPDNDDKSFISSVMGNTFYMITIISIVVVSSLFGITVGGTEFGRYRLFALMVPLYSRMKGTKILSHALREQIYNHIKQYPGDHYRSIMNKLELKNGTLVHHLTRLEQEELIKSEKDGLYKRFYPTGMKVPRSNVGMYYPDGTVTYNISDKQVSEIQMNIMRTLADSPGISQKEIADKVNESRRVVNYHIQLLAKAKLIKVQREGRETKCFLQVDLT